MKLDKKTCYRALQTRDTRFDGRIFVGVHTTGIYCRPICPVRCPKLENVTFYASAAAAQEAGFRPCLRCRPESSPDLAAWRGTSNTVARALAFIAEGALDGEDTDVEALAERLGVGERQLRRLFQKHLGASPVAVSQTRRVLFAKQLIHETDMKMSDIAMAAGFGSVRRFNDTFQRLYGRGPSALRQRRTAAMGSGRSDITLALPYAAPYDWDAMIDFFAARAIPGIEVVQRHRYRRTISLAGHHGIVEISPLTRRNALLANIRFPEIKALPAIVSRIRQMFDLAADIRAITRQLATDLTMASLVKARPGLRVPGAWDGFELAVRAILGQQVSVSAARRLIGKIVVAYGEPLSHALGPAGDDGLAWVFPSPARLARADLSGLGIPKARALSLSTVAAAAAAEPTLFQRRSVIDIEDTVSKLRKLVGIGEWTAQYIALRALRDPDAFPAADIGLLRAATAADNARPTASVLLARSRAWRPWRAYAAQHLWTHDAQARSASSHSRTEELP